jgi:hypothetical protein
MFCLTFHIVYMSQAGHYHSPGQLCDSTAVQVEVTLIIASECRSCKGEFIIQIN